MSGVPQNFQSISPVIGSYDWIDLATGSGYRRYYGAGSGSAAIFLSSRLIDSSTFYYYNDVGFNSAVAVKTIDMDFDITMLLPCIVSGKAYINATFRVWNNAGSHGYMVFIVKHVTTGGTETSLGTATGGTADNNEYSRECLVADLTTKHFSSGEKLRLTIEVWGWNPGLNTGNLTLYFDPTSQVTFTDPEGRTIGTNLIFDCPFKVNL